MQAARLLSDPYTRLKTRASWGRRGYPRGTVGKAARRQKGCLAQGKWEAELSSSDQVLLLLPPTHRWLP